MLDGRLSPIILTEHWNRTRLRGRVLGVKNVRIPFRRVAFASILYLLAYCLASYLDLWTTRGAIAGSGAHEGNAFATSHDVYMPTRALLINVAAAFIMTGCVIFAANCAASVETQWLRHPLASFRRIYLNPCSPAAIGVSPLHMLSMALGFLAMRLLAAGNNLLIYLFGVAPIGAPIALLTRHTSPVIAFSIVIVPLFYVLAMAVSPFAAKLLVVMVGECSGSTASAAKGF